MSFLNQDNSYPISCDGKLVVRVTGSNQLKGACFNAFKLAAIFAQRTFKRQVMDSMNG